MRRISWIICALAAVACSRGREREMPDPVGHDGSPVRVVHFQAAPSDTRARFGEQEYGCYLGTGLEWILAPGTDQVTRAYDADGVQTYTLIDPSDVEELEITGYTRSMTQGSSASIQVRWHKGSSLLLTSSYPMTVIKEEGPKVWLGDGTGRGFIIKK